MPCENAIKRATIGATIVMTLRDMRSNPSRSIRNALDFFESYAGEVPADSRFSWFRKILEENRKGFFGFLLFLVKHVDLQTIKAVGTNMLFNRVPSLNAKHGALNERSAGSASAGGDALTAVQGGKQRNIYFFVVYGRRLLKRRDIVFDLCRQNRDCVFYLVVGEREIDDDFARRAAAAKNVIVSVRVRTDLPEAELCRGNSRAFALLKKYRCMFGFNAFVDSAGAEACCSRRFLDYTRRAGCVFGLYACGRESGRGPRERRIHEMVKKAGIFKRIPVLADEEMDRNLQSCFESGGRGYLFFGRKRLHIRYSLSGKP